MLANLVSWRYSSLFVLVITLEELRGQSTLNGVSNNYCGSESRIKSDPSSSQSETLDRIELQIRVLEENLYQATVDSKARSDQTEKEILNLRSEIQFLRSRSCICSSVTNQPDEPQARLVWCYSYNNFVADFHDFIIKSTIYETTYHIQVRMTFTLKSHLHTDSLIVIPFNPPFKNPLSGLLTLCVSFRICCPISGVGTTGSAGSADPPLFGARGRAGSGPPYFR